MRKFDDDQVERMCGKKISYSTKKIALTVKNKREKHRYKNGSLRIYCCPICQGYHITHTKLWDMIDKLN